MRFLEPARIELRETVHYYNEIQAGLGDSFRDEAWGTIQRIQEFPHAWQALGGEIRRCQTNRFPFGVIYEPTQQEIVIIAIAHMHMEPSYWRERLRRG
jgi:hypothetical protein